MEEKIVRVEAHCIELPYVKPIQFASLSESTGKYLILRLVTSGGAEGIAECVARPGFSGEDPRLLSYQIETFFAPILEGSDPLGHNRILRDIGRIRSCGTARALIDLALWDLRGKILGQPVWRLLGGGPVAPVPVAWIVHGDSMKAMCDQAINALGEGGFSALKIKTWRRSEEDVEMVAAIRQAVGDDVVLWVDANSTYSETEARTVLSKLADYNVSFIEEPCRFSDPSRMAAMARDLPVALLGDQSCDSLEAVHYLSKINAVGAVSVKLRRTGISEALKIIGLCEAAGLPVVIGTDSESRIGSLARIHLRAAIPSLAPWPTETHFFKKLADDVFAGEFVHADGCIGVPDAPGFGASIDPAKLDKYRM